MTTKQIDKLLGHEIKVRWPAYNQTDTLTPILRRKGTRVIEARVKSTGRTGVFNVSEMELVEVI